MQKSLHRFLAALLAAALIWAGLPVRPAYAAGYVVNSLADTIAADGVCTLREAIEAANNTASNDCGAASAAADTITFSVSGTITLGSTLPNIAAGQGALTIDGGGNITISGGGSVQVLAVNSGAALTLQNLTISNGFSATSSGGIRNQGTLVITNSTFSNNTGRSGGAIHNLGDVQITSSTFTNNNANGNVFGGGAIYSDGGATDISQSLFDGNRANGNGGGAISTNIDSSIPVLNVSQSTFRNNFTYYNFGSGGAIRSNGDLTVTETTFNGNYTSGNDTFNSQNGGAVSAINGVIQFTNVTMSDNRANGSGGAFYYRNDDDATLNNVTIASNQADADNNTAGDGGGIYVQDNGGPGVLSLRNSILALNSDPSGGAPDCFGDIIAAYSLIGNTTGCTLLPGSANNLIGSNPNLGPLANNGGPTQTRALLAGSPAIDAADPGASCAAADQRGTARYDGNYDSIVRCDMGAYEFDQPAPPPTSASTLPATGFPLGRQTLLPAQPLEKAYAAYDDLVLEIPALGVKAPIVGVLKSGKSWDVTWLGNSAGWLEGSAFPTWSGNTVLTGHVWDADNTPGIFASLKSLKYGDRFYIHAFGQTYVYEVRENAWVLSGSGVSKVFKHEEYDWVTLLTCEGYNPLTGKYFFRRLVRAALVQVK